MGKFGKDFRYAEKDMYDFVTTFTAEITSQLPTMKSFRAPVVAVRIGISSASRRPGRLVSYVISPYYRDKSARWIFGTSVYAA